MSNQTILGTSLCADGALLVLLAEKNKNGEPPAVDILTISPSSKVLSEQRLGISHPILIGSINCQPLIGYIQGHTTLISLGDEEWSLPYPMSCFGLTNVGGDTYVVGVATPKPGEVILVSQKIMEDGSLGAHRPMEQLVKPVSGLTNIMVSDGNHLYVRSSQKITQFSLEGGGHLVLEGTFNVATAASHPYNLLIVTPSRVFVQRDVEIYNLLEPRLIDRLRFDYSVTELSVATASGYALLLVNGKESIARGELVLINREGKVILRDGETWSSGFHKLVSSPASSGFLMFGSEEIRRVEVNESMKPESSSTRGRTH